MSTKRATDSSGQTASTVSGWPLRRKMALALAVPLLLAGTFGALRVQSDLVKASNSSASAKQVTVLRPAADYLTAAEKAMVAAVGTDAKSKAALEDALDEIDDAGRELLAAKESAHLTGEQRYQVDAVLDLSQALRAQDAITLSPGTWVAQLRQLQSGVTQLVASIVNEQITPEPRLELLSQALAGRFSLAMQQALVATERTGETGSLQLFSEFGAESAAIDRLASALGASEQAVASLRTANAQRFRTVRTGGTDLGGAAAYADYDAVIGSLQDAVDDELAAAAREARVAAALNAAVTLAALGVAILLALLISRLLLNPIRRVREGALAVAHHRLPEAVARIRAGEEPDDIAPIDVTTEEEIGQLARAVDDMHRQAVVLASGEANLRSQVSAMFVTLSRRNNSLINQQLGLIERLERDEEDPKRLDSLFRLDHLAARIRRTADSLLILADAPTVTAVADGLSVDDALQAATSGVQDYKRVRIRSNVPVRISDGAAADVVHLLTEVVDNALSYSPPTSTVEVDARATSQGVVVEVVDAGLGIPAEQLATINEGLRSGAEVTPETARRMGLFVVSRLSHRHGIATSLRANPEGGTTVEVVLPVAILPDLAPAPNPKRSASHPRQDAAAAKTRNGQEAKAPKLGLAGSKVEEPPAQMDSERGPEKSDRRPEKKSDRWARKLDRRSERRARKGDAARAENGESDAIDVTAWIKATLGAPSAKKEPGLAPDPAVAEQPERPAGLPTRTRGATRLPDVVEAEEPGAEVVEAEVPVADVVEAEEPVVEVVEAEEPVAEVVEAEEPVAEVVEAEVPVADVVEAGEPVAAPAMTALPEPAPEPVPAPAPAREPVPSALDGDWTDRGDEGLDTPIFRSLRSAWLSTGDSEPWRTSEIEEGWQKADQVVETPAAREVTHSGLPVRRPGTRLMPGGVTRTASAVARDPEAIRARLAAHAIGVTRGRAAATALSDPS